MKKLSAIVLVAFALSCASVPLKQRVSAVHQTARVAITEADDAERRTCAPAPPPNSNHCTSATAAAVGLTDAKHQEISRVFAEVYRYDIAAGNAIITWRAGDPVPAAVSDFLRATGDLLSVARTIRDTALLQRAEALVKRAQTFYDLFAR